MNFLTYEITYLNITANLITLKSRVFFAQAGKPVPPSSLLSGELSGFAASRGTGLEAASPRSRPERTREPGLPPSGPHLPPGGSYQVLKSPVRLGADCFPALNHESWNRGNAAGAGILPVTVDRGRESPLSQGLFRHPAIKADGPGDLFQDRDIGDVPASSEVGPKYRQVKLIPPAQSLSPFPEFLRPAAIIGSRAPPPGKPQLGGDFLEMLHGGREIQAPPFEKLLEADPRCRGFRMQGEGNPPDPDVVFCL